MTTPRGTLTVCAALMALALAPATAGAATTDVYYERALMSAANGRCTLFTAPVALALDAAGQQARSAALRAGISETELKAVKRRAELRAYSLSCANPDLTRAATRVRDGFEGYAKLWSMNFPGQAASWSAFRATPTDRAPDARWALSQTGAGGVMFGLVADRQGRALTVVVPDAAGASGARLVMRDPALAPVAYIDPQIKGLPGRMAPRSVSQAWLASDRGPASSALSVAGGQAFRFPESAIEAIEALDPRETVAVELVFPSRSGENVRRSLFEVGDFAAARAFLAAK